MQARRVYHSKSLSAKVFASLLTTTTQDLARLPAVVSHFPVVVPYPKRTRTIRIVVGDQNGGRIGTAELDRKSIDAAPDAPTPEPQLAPAATGHPPAQNLQ